MRECEIALVVEHGVASPAGVSCEWALIGKALLYFSVSSLIE